MTGWTDLIGWTLLRFLWQGLVIVMGAAVLLALLGRALAQTRYVAACAALALMLAAPLVTAVTISTRSGDEAMSSPTSRGAVAPRTASSPDARRPAATAGALASRSTPSRTDLLPSTWTVARGLPSLVALWLSGVVFLTCRLAVGWRRVRTLHRDAHARIPSRWAAAAGALARRLGIAHRVHVVDSEEVETPTVIGWWRPVVLLPIAALANLSPAQVEAILAHELAHVRRHDFFVNILQSIAETLLFYHPAVWWLSARIRVEREHCCDDVAVDACGDAVTYAEALIELASWRQSPPSMAMAATGGSLLDRVRRVLRAPADNDRCRAKQPFVIACTLIVIVAIGAHLLVAAQRVDRRAADDDHGLPPPQALNELVGFSLVPPLPHYVTDDPIGARAWDVTVAFPGGEMPFIGFTARNVICYAFGLEGQPLLDGPPWLDTESQTLRATTPAATPDESDVRLALRIALEQQFGVTVGRIVRNIPVYGLVVASSDGQLGPNLHPSTADCLEGGRARAANTSPRLVARDQNTLVCGIDNGFFGPTGYRVTLDEFAQSLRRLPMDAASDREVVNHTGVVGTFDFALRPGPLPLAAIASAHPDLLASVRRLGVLTLPEAIEQQLGLRMVPMDVPRDIEVITSAHRPIL